MVRFFSADTDLLFCGEPGRRNFPYDSLPHVRLQTFTVMNFSEPSRTGLMGWGFGGTTGSSSRTSAPQGAAKITNGCAWL
mmetsp:Transcript_3983/g.5480  ORF Transcript_3983/g.5480 Transcript_3983/m.5480 type:complete len:80 (+) Transcript_3983:1773-2012(+)